MKTFEIKPVLNDKISTLTVQEDTSPGSYIVTKNQKFVTRLFKDTDDRWKTREVSDLNPSDINTIGEEIDLYLEDNQQS
ncbi:hypothetical protein [Rubrolithibacter danxiaensis]|uniref:hypothetical protein n=1 Tax=Rubrolithibacter danxiaensis TaxID=3390805 RepID=UPI003BF7B23D